MTFSGLDTAAVSRALSLLAERPGDIVDALFESQEIVQLPPEGEPPGIRRWRESGLAVRLLRDDDVWISSRDGFGVGALRDSIRRVARAYPRTAFPLPDLNIRSSRDEESSTEATEDLLRFPSRLAGALRQRRVAFPLRVVANYHRRDLQVVGPRVVAPAEYESFFSTTIETPWHRFGDLHCGRLGESVDSLADRLVERFRAREAASPETGEVSLLLGSQASAVLLHEGVAHALEADTLAKNGSPEIALGLELATPLVSVVDDPSAAPEGVRRQTDDEGVAVNRRFLLRDGVVEQLLADRMHAERSTRLEPGAGRRSNRHQPPGPRSTFLELLPGDGGLEDLVEQCGDGLYAPEADRGFLDVAAGVLEVSFPYGRRIHQGRLMEPVGPFLIRERVADVLSRVVAVGGQTSLAGAGWCAKGGQRLPVWASTAAVLVEAIEVVG